MTSLIRIWTSTVRSHLGLVDQEIPEANAVADFALRLPGFSLIPGITIPIISYWDGQPLR